jgi:hypothetical protein
VAGKAGHEREQEEEPAVSLHIAYDTRWLRGFPEGAFKYGRGA